jgi:L-lactate dehydrogenase complex protein LldF
VSHAPDAPLPPFDDRVREALKNERLHIALDRATAALGSRRSTALGSLPNADLVRDVARRAKMDMLHDLAGHLERFEEKLTANGVHVHWAENGAQANQIVLDIAKKHAVKRIVKGKSMASEETHLNHALEGAGLHVVETDLGEYIVQLAKDRPSHIILPIIHMTREDIGKVMHDTIQVPYSDDTATLAGYARVRLREEFLRADMGITGTNFGVVENGALCLVTNEGNGRMSSTLPRVHVMLMGIERIVPTMHDLDLYLKLLARSATGQKLTVYTTMFRGPRRAGDECGPEELHVVLLDNGRSGVLGGKNAEILGCIRCGACLNGCPVYKSIGGHAYGDTYPGPIGAILTPELRGVEKWKELPSASSLCGACRDVCPVRLDIPRMLLVLRNEANEETPAPFQLRMGMKVFRLIGARPGLYNLAASIGRRALRLLARDGWVKKAPGLAGGWTRVRDLKAPAPKTFQQMFKERKRPS